jgi:hypothetical protein
MGTMAVSEDQCLQFIGNSPDVSIEILQKLKPDPLFCKTSKGKNPFASFFRKTCFDCSL